MIDLEKYLCVCRIYSPCRVTALFHFHQPGLVQSARVNIDAVAVRCRSHSQVIVVLDSFLHVFRVILLDVVVGPEIHRFFFIPQ